jgi:hypothetical protein
LGQVGVVLAYVVGSIWMMLDAHLIDIEKGPDGRWIYTVFVDHEARKLVVYAGYLFAQN